MTTEGIADVVVRRGRRLTRIAHGPSTAIPLLSERQRYIIACRCDRDMSNAEIGYELGLSEHTVKNHVTVILARLGAVTMHSVCMAYGRVRERDETIPLPERAARAADV